LIRASPPKEKGFKIDKKSSSMDIFSWYHGRVSI
jgi:hypothetical protein